MKTGIFLLILLLPLTDIWANGRIIDNDANVLLLANRAKQLTELRNSSEKAKHINSLRASPLASTTADADCGGVAIGNVRPVLGDHRKHETTVIIQGHVINTNNNC